MSLMLRPRNAVVLIMVVCSGSGCVLPPLSNDVTARSLPKGDWSTHVGVMQGDLVYARQDYGLSDSLDLGLTAEGGLNSVIGLQGKYTLHQAENEPSLAAIAGIGGGRVNNNFIIADRTTTGVYAFGGLIASYAWEHFEAYFVPRYQGVLYEHTITLESGEELDLRDAGSRVAYASFTLGGTWWFNKGVGLTANVSTLFAAGQFGDGFGGLGLVLRYCPLPRRVDWRKLT